MNDCENNEKCSLCLNQENIMNARSAAKEGLETQAKEMLKTSNLKFKTVPVGKTVSAFQYRMLTAAKLTSAKFLLW